MKAIEGNYATVRETDNKVLGLIAERYKIVQNREGKNVTSSMSLFVNGKHHINLDDVFVISDVEYDVIALAPFYREGRKDIWVVYI